MGYARYRPAHGDAHGEKLADTLIIHEGRNNTTWMDVDSHFSVSQWMLIGCCFRHGTRGHRPEEHVQSLRPR
jgi:hypothetical protein